MSMLASSRSVLYTRFNVITQYMYTEKGVVISSCQSKKTATVCHKPKYFII